MDSVLASKIVTNCVAYFHLEKNSPVERSLLKTRVFFKTYSQKFKNCQSYNLPELCWSPSFKSLLFWVLRFFVQQSSDLSKPEPWQLSCPQNRPCWQSSSWSQSPSPLPHFSSPKARSLQQSSPPLHPMAVSAKTNYFTRKPVQYSKTFFITFPASS